MIHFLGRQNKFFNALTCPKKYILFTAEEGTKDILTQEIESWKVFADRLSPKKKGHNNPRWLFQIF